ncbi:MAG: type II toxin-antitoxin system VapC family toxin [Candidatus Asgardarchaeia archaeon]
MSILIDTNIFFGFYSKDDIHHYDSVILIILALEGTWGSLYITDHILDETINLLKYKISNETALDFINAFLDSKNVNLITVTNEIIMKALSLFKSYWDIKGFSLTDAVSIIVANDYHLDYIMTFDYYLSKFIEIIDNRYIKQLPPTKLEYIKKLLKRYNIT